jgi:Uma2 family endonuclease
MSTVRSHRPPREPAAEPAWDVAYLYPLQGEWSEAAYFALPGNRLVEYDDGVIEVLPLPTQTHQLILLAFYHALLAFAQPGALGRVLVAPMRVQTGRRQYREPDVLFMLARHAARMHDKFWQGADLVAEVVSDNPEDRDRDLIDKPLEYAKARIPEYWIIDPKEETITVLRLKGRKYVVHGKFARGEKATSVLLEGFAVEVGVLLEEQ